MADLLGIQILGSLFGIFMLYYTFLHYKRKDITIKEGSFWMGLWALFIFVAIFPGLLDPILDTLSIARTLDFFIIVGFLFLIGAFFYTYLIVRKNQKKIEEIVRKVALKK